ncbi:MAG: hypothetical protein ACLPYS_17060 [Vulcanimicrobiaceae bacterium]
MRIPTDLPDIAIARVRTDGAPYLAGDTLSLAFATPAVARLALHERELEVNDALPGESFLPETIAVEVVLAGGPFTAGQCLMLSFMDPRIARIHVVAPGIRGPAESVAPAVKIGARPRNGARSADAAGKMPVTDVPAAPACAVSAVSAPPAVSAEPASAAVPSVSKADCERIATAEPVASGEQTVQVSLEPHAAAFGAAKVAAFVAKPASGANEAASGEPAVTMQAEARLKAAEAAPASVVDERGVRVRLDWNPDGARRFVQLVDKLFTVDRLGWYRHAFAMRLLVPDEVSVPEPAAELEARRHLGDLRAAAVETLGRPLLAAFMPNFVVTPDWLDSLDVPSAARALAGLREAILPHLDDAPAELRVRAGSAHSIGSIERKTFLAAPAGSVEALLPAFIATVSADETLTACSNEYRRALLELFGQTAQSAEAVRVKQMAQPNHALDDRLWQLVSAVQAAFGELAAV